DYETQVSEGEEGNLRTRFVECKKNSGHKKFIPVDTFTLKHLPKRHQDKDLHELIKATAELTVK
ncbi:Phospholipase A and acyltransferase 3, partial [Biomphalaria glabrata]